jgi:hypothetical protein
MTYAVVGGLGTVAVHAVIVTFTWSGLVSRWQVAAPCLVAAPGVLLGLFLLLRRQRMIGVLLVTVGILPLLLRRIWVKPPPDRGPGISSSRSADQRR